MTPITASRLIRIGYPIAKIAAAVLGIWMTIQVVLVIDASVHGPYCTWYNNDCLRLSMRASLVGRPESDVKSVLGKSSSVWEYDQPSGRTRTYNYAPSAADVGMFQVHCRGGKVVLLEQFDD